MTTANPNPQREAVDLDELLERLDEAATHRERTGSPAFLSDETLTAARLVVNRARLRAERIPW